MSVFRVFKAFGVSQGSQAGGPRSWQGVSEPEDYEDGRAGELPCRDEAACLRSISLAVCFALFLSAHLVAQQQPDTSQTSQGNQNEQTAQPVPPPPTTTTATPTTGTSASETVVVSATRTEEPVGEIPGQATVVTGEELKKKNVNNLADAIQDVLGIDTGMGSDNGPRQPNVGVWGLKEFDALLFMVDG